MDKAAAKEAMDLISTEDLILTLAGRTVCMMIVYEQAQDGGKKYYCADGKGSPAEVLGLSTIGAKWAQRVYDSLNQAPDEPPNPDDDDQPPPRRPRGGIPR